MNLTNISYFIDLEDPFIQSFLAQYQEKLFLIKKLKQYAYIVVTLQIAIEIIKRLKNKNTRQIKQILVIIRDIATIYIIITILIYL